MMLAFDIETYTKKQDGYYHPIRNTNKFVSGCIGWINRNGNYKDQVFYNKENMRQYIYDLADRLARKKKSLYLYAHWGQYDYYGLFKQDILKHNIIMLDNIYVQIKPNAYIVDTKSFFKKKLSEVAKDIGMEKLEMPPKVKTIEEITPYLKKDVEILIKAVTKRRRDLQELGSKAKYMITAGQLSKSRYTTWLKNNRKRLFYKYFQKGTLIGTKYDEFHRKAYKIGRCEAFQTGKFSNCTKIDVNSLFPYAMTLIDFPDIRTEYVLNYPLKHIKLDSLLNNYVGTVKATLKIPKIELGYLGIKYNDYDIYPKKEGTIITGYWCISEIKKAINIGYKLLDIRKAVFYKKTNDDMFRTYMKELYQIRINNKHLDQTIKMLMNTLHGKLGVKNTGKKWVIDGRDKYDEYIRDGYQVKAFLDQDYYYEKPDTTYKPNFAHVAISAQIIAKAKELMYDEYIKIRPEDLLYTDIDSIMFKGNYINKFKISQKIFGWFKTEQENEKAYIRKEKLYEIGDEIKASGIAKDQIGPGEIEWKNEFLNYKMITLPEAIKRGNLDLIGDFVEEPFIITDKQKINLEIPMVVNEK